MQNTFLLLDLLSFSSTKAINTIYNLNSDSPTTISLYYKKNIKNNPFVNEFNVILDIIQYQKHNKNNEYDETKNYDKTKENYIPDIIYEVSLKINNLKKFLEFYSCIEEEETKLSQKLLDSIENTLVINFTDDTLLNEKLIESLAIAFSRLLISTWNIYNKYSKKIKPYFLESRIDYLRKIGVPIAIDYFLSDYLNYQILNKEIIEWLVLDIELEILSLIVYMQNEELENLRDILLNITSTILQHIENFEEIQDLYIDLRGIYNEFQLIPKNQLKCPYCKDFINQGKCQKCNIYFIDLLSNIPFLKTVFRSLVIQDINLFKYLIDKSIEGLKNIIKVEDKNFFKIISYIKETSVFPHIKTQFGSIEIIYDIIEKFRNLRDLADPLSQISYCSLLMLDINHKLENISLLFSS